MNSAIIVAAGAGKRFGSDTPKQFLEILGKPVIIHTLERFDECEAVNEIVLVLPAAESDRFRDLRLSKPLKFIAGGETRAESVLNGLNGVGPSTGTVAVHDGARPLVSAAEIAATIELAERIGAACLVAPLTDTIKEVRHDRIFATLDRDKLKRALTPQCFRYELLKRAFAEFGTSELATDECYLIEKLGAEIAYIEGSPRNIKITHADDLALAEFYLSRGI